MIRHCRAAFARVAGVFAKQRADEELREELFAHVDMETAEYVRRGMEPGVARRKALIASGGLAPAAEAVRNQRGLPWLEGVASDIRYAQRALFRSREITLVS